MSQTINIYPFGMNVDVNTDKNNNITNFMIFLIGPLTNIILVFVISSMWWHFPVMYFYTKDFVLANFCLGFFNIIPIYPLDGGNMILSLFKNYKSKLKVLKIMKVCAIIFSLLFMILFILSCFSTINFSCFCISIFLFSTIFSYKEILYNEIKKKFDNLDNVKEYQAYVVKFNTKFEEIEKCIDENKFVHFYLLNESNKVVKVLTQEEMLNLFNKNFDEGKENRRLQS